MVLLREPPTQPKIEEVSQPKPEHLDLNAKVYPSYEMVDEHGRSVEYLRGTYETGDNDGEAGISAVDLEGYRSFKTKRKMQSWNEINNYDVPGEFKSTFKKRPVCSIAQQTPSTRPQETPGDMGGHFTVYGHEWIPHTGINALLTQNPVIGLGRFGYVEDGCGENKKKHLSPTYHPISFDPSYEYWDEGKYHKIFKIDEKSLDTYEIYDAIQFKCDRTGKNAFSHIICINHHNNQVHVWCPKCHKKQVKYPWHQIKNHEILESIEDDLGMELIKYKKAEIEEEILKLVLEIPGINKYQIGQELDMPKGKVSRGVTRLKKQHLVRTRKVGKAICTYPILKEMGTDLQYKLCEKVET